MKEFLNSIIEARTAELNSLKDAVKNETDAAKVEEMYSRAQALDREIAEARSKLAEISNPVVERENAEARAEFGGSMVKTAATENAEARGKDLKEGRSVTVASSSLVVPEHTSDTIREGFNEVPHSLIEGISYENFQNGDTYEVPYIVGYGTGDIKAEGADYATAEPTFGYATIAKNKITAYAEISREAQKLPSANYEEKVVGGVRVAILKKLAALVILGTGSNQPTGIFSATAITDDPVEISAIGPDTLTDIVFAYGGDIDVDGLQTLILSKSDLQAFAKARQPLNGLPAYNIENHGSWGFINGIHYVISDSCPALSKAATAAGTKCMAYGNLKDYVVSEFNPMEVERSDDYAFKKGMTAYRGDIMLGGNVCAANAFVLVKKVEA